MIVKRQQSQQNACMASITIRDVPDETRSELAARAARSGRSMQEYLRLHLIDLAERPDQGEVWERIRSRVRRTGTRLSAEEILDAVHADRR
jgi:plasmid stability protein